MDIRWYRLSDFISVVWFYFDGINAKIGASSQAKLLIGHEKQKNIFAEAGDGKIRKLVDNSAQRKMKIC